MLQAGGLGGIAMGFNAKSFGAGSVSLGYDTNANAAYATAIGYQTMNNKTKSVALGLDVNVAQDLNVMRNLRIDKNATIENTSITRDAEANTTIIDFDRTGTDNAIMEMQMNGSGNTFWKTVDLGPVTEFYLGDIDHSVAAVYLYGSLYPQGSMLFPDYGTLYFGDGTDFSIYHDGTNTNLDSVTGTLQINGKTKVTGDLNITQDLNVTRNFKVDQNISVGAVLHGQIDWITVPISVTLTGTAACDNLDAKIANYTYTCQTCVDALAGTSIACGTIASVMENCGCKVD